MTHEKLMKELHEVSAFLLKKADLLEKQAFLNEGKINLENQDDWTLFNVLYSACKYTDVHKFVKE